jgi:tyrosine-protein phosphatase YwqE
MLSFAKNLVPKCLNGQISKIQNAKSLSKVSKKSVQKLSNRYLSSKSTTKTNSYLRSDIHETRDFMRKEIISQMTKSEKNRAQEYLEEAKLMLLTSEFFPITVSYDYRKPTDKEMLFVIQSLTDMGYSIRNVKCTSDGACAQSATSMDIHFFHAF